MKEEDIKKINLLHAQVAVRLHMDAVDVTALLGRVLEMAHTAPVHGDLAVALHPELNRAVLAKQAVVHLQPLVVT